MLCTGSGCDRAAKCGLYWGNPQPDYRRYDNAEYLATFGCGSADGSGEWYCGELGNYKMFVPLTDQFWFEKIAADLNLYGCGIYITPEHVRAMIEQFRKVDGNE